MFIKKQPEVIAGAIVYNNEGDIFLAKSYKWQNTWVIPGGHVQYGEKLTTAMIREVKEETNMDVANVKLINVNDNLDGDVYYKKKHLVFINFYAKYIGGEIKLNEELQEYEWFKPAEALKLDLIPSMKILLQTYIEKNEKN